LQTWPTFRIRVTTSVVAAHLIASGPAIGAVTLEPRTIAAFERYVAETDRESARSLADEAGFLWVDAVGRERDRAAVRAGQLVISRLETKSGGRKIDVPDGIIHHWLGVVFVPGATVDRAVALLQDYDRHAAIYSPNVARSRLLSRDGDFFKVYLRFYAKNVLTVVVNSEHEARFTRPSPDRAYSRIVSTRIAEVEDPGGPDEKEKPMGRDGGYLWRLNSSWRFLERDGGTYVQCESITLTRSVPVALAFIIKPFINGIPRETLTFTLERTRGALKAGATSPSRGSTAAPGDPPAARALRPAPRFSTAGS
jgi:hypothetical protein